MSRSLSTHGMPQAMGARRAATRTLSIWTLPDPRAVSSGLIVAMLAMPCYAVFRVEEVPSRGIQGGPLFAEHASHHVAVIFSTPIKPFLSSVGTTERALTRKSQIPRLAP